MAEGTGEGGIYRVERMSGSMSPGIFFYFLQDAAELIAELACRQQLR
jgi:hypothetical protein